MIFKENECINSGLFSRIYYKSSYSKNSIGFELNLSEILL